MGGEGVFGTTPQVSYLQLKGEKRNVIQPKLVAFPENIWGFDLIQKLECRPLNILMETNPWINIYEKPGSPYQRRLFSIKFNKILRFCWKR